MPAHSPSAQARQPKQKVSKTSLIADTVKKRIFLNKKEATSPHRSPIPRDPSPKTTNFKRIAKGNFTADICYPVEILSFSAVTVQNKINATASLTIPSPKMIENSLGCSSYFTIDIAAITSDEHKREASKKLSISSNYTTSSLFN